jgi:hypothetical protein
VPTGKEAGPFQASVWRQRKKNNFFASDGSRNYNNKASIFFFKQIRVTNLSEKCLSVLTSAQVSFEKIYLTKFF